MDASQGSNGVWYLIFWLMASIASAGASQSLPSDGIEEPPPPRLGEAARRIIEKANFLAAVEPEVLHENIVRSDWYARDPEAPLTILRIAWTARKPQMIIQVGDQLLEVAHAEGDTVALALGHELRAAGFTDLAEQGNMEAASQAREDHERAAALWEEIGAGPERVAALCFISTLLVSTNGDEQEIHHFADMAVAALQAERERPLEAARRIYEIGDYALRGLGKVELARKFLEAALVTQERVAPQSWDTAVTLFRLGWLQNASGQPRKAEPYLLRAETLARQINPESEVHGSILAAIGSMYYLLGQHAEAEKSYRHALAIHESFAQTSVDARLLAGADHRVLGVIFCQQDRWTAAREHLEDALAIQESILPNGSNTARVLVNLGDCVAARQGDFAAAEWYYRRALTIYEEHHPGQSRYGYVLYEFGRLAHSQGDWETASTYLRRALEFNQRRMPQSERTARNLGALGLVAMDKGQFEEAEHHTRAALEMAVAIDPDLPLAADLHQDLGSVLLARGDTQEAEIHLHRALTIRETSAEDHPRSPPILNQLGALALAGEQTDEAIGYYRRALAIRESNLGESHFWLSNSLHGLATALAVNGDTDAAFDTALRLERIRTDHLRFAMLGHTEQQALTYAALRAGGLNIVLSLLSGEEPPAPGAPLSAWDAIIRSRGIVLDEMSNRRRIQSGSMNPESRQLLDSYSEACGKLARLVIRGRVGDDLETYHRALDVATEEKERTEKALTAADLDFRQRSTAEGIGFEEVAAQLPPETGLVSFFKYHRYDFGAEFDPSTQEYPATPQYMAFVFHGSQDHPAAVPLGPANLVDGLVRKLQAQIYEVAASPDRGILRAEQSHRRDAHELGRLIWAPIQAALGDVDRVLLVPDGSLNLVNIAALPTGDTDYLIDAGPVLHLLSAERDLLWSGADPLEGGMLALGAPAYDDPSLFASLSQNDAVIDENEPLQIASSAVFRGARSSCGDFNTMRFEALPESAGEARQVAELFREHARTATGPESPDFNSLTLLGSEAREGAFKNSARGKTVLHLATHGFFLGGQCESALDHAPSTGMGKILKYSTGENPLLLSGLALAGANLREAAGTEEEDGILTAEEIATLDLTAAEWAVLSACETGVGEVRAGEGVFGLRRAFQIAGADTVIMSLWPVEDETSREWMRKLYEHRFVDGLSTVESVHRSSLDILKQRRREGLSTHPFFWAGFVAAGDWR